MHGVALLLLPSDALAHQQLRASHRRPTINISISSRTRRTVLSSMSTPLPPFLSHSAQSMQRVQAVLARRESQRRTVCFSDPDKLATVSLDVLPQSVRDAFSAHVATSPENASKNRCQSARPLEAGPPCN